MLSLAAPLFLLLLGLLGPIVIMGRRRIARRRMREGVATLALRCAALTVLVVALAQPRWEIQGAAPVYFVLDTSASIPPTTRGDAEAWIRTALSRNHAGAPVKVITFAAFPLLQPGTAGTVAPSTAKYAYPAQQDQTDIEAALRLALASAPDRSRIVLLSDGRETLGSARLVESAARARSIAINVVPLEAHGLTDAALTRLQAPIAVHAGDATPLFITIRSTVNHSAALTLWQDGQTVGVQSVALHTGDNPFEVVLHAGMAGSHTYRARVTMAGDQAPQNDALSAVTSVAEAPRVLAVSLPNKQMAPLVARLVASGFAVDQRLPAAFPTSMGALSPYDGIVLNDLPARALSARQVDALQRAVHDGGIGVFLLGGAHSLTLGGYTRTPLERLLPVYSVTPGIVQKGSISLELVMDKSGSMDNLAGDFPKIQMAQQAAIDAARFMVQYKDELGIVSFDIAANVLLPRRTLTSSADVARAQNAIDSLQADGGTNIYGALKLGLQQIASSAAPYKHIVLMTDGRSDPADYRGLLATMRAQHITLSTIGLGSDADVDLLRRLATAGKGRFYYTADAATLPKLFVQEARLSTGPTQVTGNIPVSVSSDSPVLRSLANQPVPHVLSYPATTIKPDASVVLMGNARGQTADPILAQWQYGLGRVVVWTPGLMPNWAGPWLTGAPDFWNDATRWILRGIRPAVLQPQLSLADGMLHVTIDTLQTSGTFVDLQRLTASIETPSGVRVPLAFAQSAPGLYEATLPPAGAGVYRLSVRQASTPPQSLTTLLAVPYAPEYRPLPPDRALLNDLAATTGGALLASPGDSFRGLSRNVDQPSTWIDLWWPLVALALALLLADIIGRLVGWRAPTSARGNVQHAAPGATVGSATEA